MSEATDILSLEEARDALNTTASNLDPKIAVAVSAISQRIDALVGPVVIRTVTNEVHDGGKILLRLRQGPVSTVTTVTEYESGAANALTAETVSSLAPNAFLFDDRDPRNPVIFRRESGGDSVFASGRRNVLVTYEAGRFATTAAVEQKYKEAARAALRRLWKREQAAWARSPAFEGDQGVPSGFFRAIDPAIAEFLPDEMKLPGIA